MHWKYHSETLSTKLSRAVGMLSKIRHYVDASTLEMIYHGIFSSLMDYSSQIWGQSPSISAKIEKLQSKAIRVMNFENFSASVDPLHHKLEILKFSGTIDVQNFLFAHSTLRGNLPRSLCDKLTFIDKCYDHQIRTMVKVPKIRTVISGDNSIIYKAAKIWNKFVQNFIHVNFLQEHSSSCKAILTEFLLINHN